MSAGEPSTDDLARELAADRRLADRRDWTLLGTGGFGSVFRVDHDDLGRREAVKVLRRALDPAGIEEFRREARLMGSIGPHPYLLTVFDAGVLDSGRPYVVAEYVAGGSLQQRLADGGPMAWSDAVALGTRVASGLQRCHDAGVLHLDIKPANILLDADGQPRLADFGVARSRLGSGVTTGAPEQSELIATTVAYSPPELLEGRVSEATDVYMLAATVHALCCGHPPFPRPRDLTEYGVPPAVAAVIEGALDPDPAHRPASAAELGAALTAAATAPPPDPPRDGAEDDTTGDGPGSRRGLLAALGVAAIVVLVMAVGGWTLLGGSDAAEPSGGKVVELFLEPLTEAGQDPFTESVALASLPEPSPLELEVEPDPGEAGFFTGTVPRLYGGSGQEQVCDTAALIGFLDESPEKAAAFAEALGIEPSEVPDYLSGLAPVALQADTWVTNHGFRDGRATPRQSVLQAGTAVLVDEFGVPRVRCSCGNPLDLPQPPDDAGANLQQLVGDESAELVGTPWPGFAPDDVITVRPGADPVDELTLVDLDTDEPFVVPVGPPPAAPSRITLTDGECAGEVSVSDGGTGTNDDGTTWSAQVRDLRPAGEAGWLAVLECSVGRSVSTVVAAVAASGEVTDQISADSSRVPGPAFVPEDVDGDTAVWLVVGTGGVGDEGFWVSEPGQFAGPNAGIGAALTVLQQRYSVDGDRLVRSGVIVESAAQGETADLDEVRAVCGALQAFDPNAFPSLARSFGIEGVPLAIGRDAEGRVAAVLPAGVAAQGELAFVFDGGDWAEVPTTLATRVATAIPEDAASGLLTAGVFRCNTEMGREPAG